MLIFNRIQAISLVNGDEELLVFSPQLRTKGICLVLTMSRGGKVFQLLFKVHFYSKRRNKKVCYHRIIKAELPFMIVFRYLQIVNSKKVINYRLLWGFCMLSKYRINSRSAKKVLIAINFLNFSEI